MNKIFRLLCLFLLFPFTVFADTFGGSFNESGPNSAYQLWVADPAGYFGNPVTPPSVQSCLDELGASSAVVNSTFLKLDSSNDPLTGGLLITSGNVGIGTMGPGIGGVGVDNILTVKSTSYYGTMEIANGYADAASQAVGYLTFVDAANLATYKNVASIAAYIPAGGTATKRGGELRFYTQADNTAGQTQQMVIDKNGNVGIGETAPGAKLSVSGGLAVGLSYDTTGVSDGQVIISGNVGIGTTAPVSTLEIIESGASPLKISNGAGGNGDFLTIKADGMVGIGTSNPLRQLCLGGEGQIQFTGDSDHYIYDEDSNKRLLFKNNSFMCIGEVVTSNHALTSYEDVAVAGKLEVNGNVFFDGSIGYFATNVGIGTIAPVSTLEIIESGASPFKISNGAGGNGNFVTVDTNGNVGIGTIAPGNPLEIVEGGGVLPGLNLNQLQPRIWFTDSDDTTANSYGQILWKQSDGGISAEITKQSQVANSLIEFNDATTNKMVIMQTGNVGIGTLSPVRKLDVLGSTGIGIGSTIAGDTLIVTSVGNVGIGSTVPLQRLDLKTGGLVGFRSVGANTATIGYTGDSVFTINGTSSNAYASLLGKWAVNNNVGIGTTVVSGGRLVVRGNGTTTTPTLQTIDSASTARLTVLDNGNVGIGTTVPVGTLDLKGTLVYTPSTTQVIDNVADTILANAALVVLNPDGDYILTSTPTIANGQTGQQLTIICANTEANIVTIQDEGALANTNLNLGAASRALAGQVVLRLIFDGTNWCEVSYAPN